mmetsp:Transcript_52439/g.93993  ORF Transcript_52439/g.93993 Transcript_52439/m.93993 type:complete len:793 (-) Transcript_52439:77-2455(-)
MSSCAAFFEAAAFQHHAAEAAVAAALAAAEQRRSAEVAALEWKLRETRRRHVEELASFSRSVGSQVSTEFEAWSGATSLDAEATSSSSSSWCSDVPLAGSFGEFGRRDQASREISGPVLASLRRDFGRRSIRLWAEDLVSLGGARLHALDESCGSRTHTDVSDAILSSLLNDYRMRVGILLRADGSEDIDEFIRFLLGACKLAHSAGGQIHIRLPSEMLPQTYPVPLVEAPKAWQPPEASFSGMIPGYILRPQTCNMVPSPNYVLKPRLAPQDRSKAQAVLQPQTREAWTQSKAGKVATASTKHGYPGKVPSEPHRPQAPSAPRPPRPQVRSSRELARAQEDDELDDESKRNSTPATSSRAARAKCNEGQGMADGQQPSRTSERSEMAEERTPARPPGQPRGRPPPGGNQTSRAGRQPQRPSIPRPQSAPHSGRRPQSARPHGRDEEPQVSKSAQAESQSRTWPLPPGRRLRPTSAKALKHRRVVDDGVDSIIYEDVEEEEEEEEQLQSRWESLDQGQEQEAGHEAPHSGTGGCSTCSSSQSLLRSRPPSASRCGRSRPASAGPGRRARSPSHSSSASEVVEVLLQEAIRPGPLELPPQDAVEMHADEEAQDQSDPVDKELGPAEKDLPLGDTGGEKERCEESLHSKHVRVECSKHEDSAPEAASGEEPADTMPINAEVAAIFAEVAAPTEEAVDRWPELQGETHSEQPGKLSDEIAAPGEQRQQMHQQEQSLQPEGQQWKLPQQHAQAQQEQRASLTLQPQPSQSFLGEREPRRSSPPPRRSALGGTAGMQ